MVSVRLALAVLVVIVAVAFVGVESAYRKPPFNGSIFGKRASTVTADISADYEVVNRALTTMCEVASETCSAWFGRQESN